MATPKQPKFRFFKDTTFTVVTYCAICTDGRLFGNDADVSWLCNSIELDADGVRYYNTDTAEEIE